jgi:hypothetical protein
MINIDQDGGGTFPRSGSVQHKIIGSMQKQNPTSMRNGALIISPWQPLGYGLYLWASFYITLLNYNKAKCNKKPCQNYLREIQQNIVINNKQ